MMDYLRSISAQCGGTTHTPSVSSSPQVPRSPLRGRSNAGAWAIPGTFGGTGRCAKPARSMA